MGDILDMVILDMVIDSCTARGRLRPILKPNPRPRLIPTTDMDTLVSDTDMLMDMVLDTVDSDMAMDLDTMAIMDLDTTDTARGLLMLRPRLIHTTDTDTDVDTTVAISDTLDTSATDLDMDMDIDTCTARGLLMLSLRPRLILTTDMDIMVSDTDMGSDMDTMVAISDTATACTAMESKFYYNLSANQQLQLRQKWIVISLKFPSPVLQFQCYHTKSLLMVSRKQENQSGKNPTNIKIT